MTRSLALITVLRLTKLNIK